MSGPVNEWIIHDAASLRKAMAGMKAKRRLSLEDLFHIMKVRVLNRFLAGEQDNLRSDTIFKAVNGMNFEMVIREPSTSRTQKRLAALKAEKEQAQAALLRQVAEDQVIPGDRDSDGRLTRPMTEQEKAQVEELLERYTHL
jgi:hypothetical protein